MTKKLVLFFVLGLAIASAQSAPSFTVSSGTTPVSQKPCSDFSNVGSMYTLYQDPSNGFSGVYVCAQIGALSLGQGAYGWIGLMSQGSSPTTGTLTVANGKTATISKTLTFTGTDGTTETFPSTSITVSGATGTFCGTTSTCAATNTSATVKMVSGQAPLVSGTPSTVVVSSIPAFTSTTSFACTVTNMTTAANNTLKVVNTSTSSITISGPNTLTDVIGYICVGS